MNTNVGVLKMFPGISKNILHSILRSRLVEGLIIETFGSGNATTEPWFIKLLSDAIDRGLYVINVTQCIAGAVRMGQYETSSQMKEIGVISAKDMTTEAAVTKLMFLLANPFEKEDLKNRFETSICGEMT